MFNGKRKHSVDFKIKVALKALKEDATLSQMKVVPVVKTNFSKF